MKQSVTATAIFIGRRVPQKVTECWLWHTSTSLDWKKKENSFSPKKRKKNLAGETRGLEKIKRMGIKIMIIKILSNLPRVFLLNSNAENHQRTINHTCLLCYAQLQSNLCWHQLNPKSQRGWYLEDSVGQVLDKITTNIYCCHKRPTEGERQQGGKEGGRSERGKGDREVARRGRGKGEIEKGRQRERGKDDRKRERRERRKWEREGKEREKWEREWERGKEERVEKTRERTRRVGRKEER